MENEDTEEREQALARGSGDPPHKADELRAVDS